MDENMALTPYETREILFYKTDSGDVKVEILLYQENLWLTQAKMAELFEVQKAAISKHLKNIFVSGELMEDSVVSVLETTAADGKNYPTRYYNLDAIIAVGYRVNSKKATMFRIWANRILKEYIIKGYVMDDERLKEPQNFFGKDYFEEQLERIRDIRSSERRFYQKITDIYSQCSADYDVDSPVTKEFFATVQNKLHYAITKHTAAEIIYDRADSTKPNMGLTTWKNAPGGRIRKSDVVIAKNYLDETEMGSLNEIVTMYLDYAERQARRGNIMYMKDWVARLDAVHAAHPFHLVGGFQSFCHAFLLRHCRNDDFHSFIAGLVNLGKVPMQRSACEQVCVENRTMFFQIAAAHTPVLSDLVFRFIWQRKVRDEVITFLTVSAAHFLK